jgi:hypothetical protein
MNKKRQLGPSASDGVSKAERKRMKMAMMRLISDESKQFDDNELSNRESRASGAPRPKTPSERAALQAIQSANAASRFVAASSSASAAAASSTASTSMSHVEPPTNAGVIESKKPRHRRVRGKVLLLFFLFCCCHNVC